MEEHAVWKLFSQFLDTIHILDQNSVIFWTFQEPFGTLFEYRNIHQLDTLHQLNTRKVWYSGPHWLKFLSCIRQLKQATILC